jgi:hypothetical protein
MKPILRPSSPPRGIGPNLNSASHVHGYASGTNGPMAASTFPARASNDPRGPGRPLLLSEVIAMLVNNLNALTSEVSSLRSQLQEYVDEHNAVS